MEQVQNITNEMLFVGAIYKSPELFVEYAPLIKSKYDFSDEAVKFYYDNAEIMFTTRTQTFNKSTVNSYMSEDKDRLAQYKKYKGFKTVEEWSKLAVADDFKNYYEILKKYSLLREYQRNGFNIEKIMSHPKFETFSALDIYRLIRGKADRIHTVILTNEVSEILNMNMTDIVNSCLETPDMGLRMPYPMLNDMFRGIKNKTIMCVGMLSNAGKSRFMFKMIAYLALVLKEKVCVLLNEMTIEKMRLCLLTTVVNNDEFKQLHGINLSKKEKEIALGLYRNSNGEFINRCRDEWGNFTESFEDYNTRVNDLSEEYRNIIKVAQWIEDETQGLIFAKDVSTAYDDKSLEFEIRKMNLTNGVKLFFYDTLKQDTSAMGDWAALKATTTRLTELTRELNIFVYASIQLTDETIYIKPDEITSGQIANAKQLKHVLDNLILAKEISPSEKSKYQYIAYDDNWGEAKPNDLKQDRRYYVMNVDKNRDGDKRRLLFEVDLNLNTWYEKGEVIRK